MVYRVPFLLNISVINAIFFVERAAFPLVLLGLLVLIQTERAPRNPLPTPMPALPVPGSN